MKLFNHRESLMKILLLENDTVLANQIEDYLFQKNYDVCIAQDITEAEEYTYRQKFDLLLLNTEGFELLQALRKTHDKTPSILITSLNDDFDLKKMYDVGFTDFIKVPFDLKELEIRIDNIKKEFNIESRSLLTITKDAKLDMKNLSIIKDECVIYVPQKEAKIINYFLQNKNRIVYTNELFMNIWSYDNAPSIATIRTYLKNIRKIIGAEYFTTIKGSGYRFNFY